MKQFFYDDDEPIVNDHKQVISLQLAISAPCRYRRWLEMKEAGEIGTQDDLHRFLREQRRTKA